MRGKKESRGAIGEYEMSNGEVWNKEVAVKIRKEKRIREILKSKNELHDEFDGEKELFTVATAVTTFF